MKKLLLILIVAVATTTSVFSQASDYKAFKVDAGLLYAIPAGKGDVKAGIGLYLEPKYNITNQIAVGLKWELAAMGSSSETSASISAVNTYQLTGDYYFNENKVRPFAGLGIGIYNLGTAEVDANDINVGNIDDDGYLVVDGVATGSKFGFCPRVGLLMGHFRAALEYNVITGIEEGLDSKNYLSIKLGFEIGGGKK